MMLGYKAHNTFAGVPLVETSAATERKRDYRLFDLLSFHKSKLKRYRPPVVEKPCAYQANGVMYIHPILAAELRRRYADNANNLIEQSLFYGNATTGK